MKKTQIAIMTSVMALTIQLAANAEPALPAPSRASAQVVDVALHEGGFLQGQVIDRAGAAQGNVPVVIAQNRKAVVVTKTDNAGRFAVRGLRGGVYEIETPITGGVYRLWAPQTAPPSAKLGVSLVAAEAKEIVVRGQNFDSNYGPALRGAIAGGLLTGGVYWALDYNPSGS